MHKTRTGIRQWISEIVGCSVGLLQHLSDSELDYIIGLEYKYQELAVWQAALSEMIRQNRSLDAIKKLQAEIKTLSKLLSDEEVEKVNSRRLYADEFGRLNPVKPYPKIEAQEWSNGQDVIAIGDNVAIDAKAFQEQLAKEEKENTALLAKQAANEFVVSHPEYFGCPENSQKIIEWIIKNKLDPTKASNYETAFKHLSAMGKLAKEPKPPKTGDTSVIFNQQNVQDKAFKQLTQKYNNWLKSTMGGALGSSASKKVDTTPKPTPKPEPPIVPVQEEFIGRKFR